jgi:hypothetical protein
MTQTWWTVVRHTLAAILAGLTAAQLYWPHSPWIAILIAAIGAAGLYGVPIAPAVYAKVTGGAK